MASILTRLFKGAYYRFVHSPLGGGKPVPAAALDDEYKSGNWDHFFGPDEQARHELMVEMILAHGPKPRLLDLGCGSGRLAAMLDGQRLGGYLGVDLSVEGLKRANALNLPHGNFQQGDFEVWRPATPYDVITFNECLGYAKNPAVTAADFGRHLRPGGQLIISHFRWGNHAAVWKSLRKYFDFIAEREATNSRGQVWDIKVLKPRAQR